MQKNLSSENCKSGIILKNNIERPIVKPFRMLNPFSQHNYCQDDEF